MVKRTIQPTAAQALSLAVSVIAFLVSAQIGSAQQVPVSQARTTQPAFEVASVKPLPDLSRTLLSVENGSFHARLGLKLLISWAYSLPFHQIVAPEWSRLTAIEIEAKAADPVGEDQLRLMLRTLLAERFNLRVHREVKNTTVTALMVDKGGNRLKVSESVGRYKRTFDGRYETFTGITMSEFAEFLAQYTNGCIDRTGITGRYDIALDYRPLIDPAKSATLEVIRTRPEAIEQLGLKLQLVTGPLEYLVVDQLEKAPTEN